MAISSSNLRSNSNIFSIYLDNGPSEVNIRTLNKLLSTSKTVGEGFELMNSFLTYCNAEAISDHLSNWMENCLKHPGDNLLEVKLSLIAKIIQASNANPDTSKKTVSEHLSKIFDLCLAPKSNCHEDTAALDVLTVCMQKYGSWFTSRKEQIEKYLISFLENSSDVVIEKAGIAFLFLQQVGNAGSEGVNHRKNFRESLQRLCTTVHTLFDLFFENAVEIDRIEKPDREGYNFDNHFLDSQQIPLVTAKRIKNVITFITIMIRKCFPVCKDIFPMDILNLVYRGTQVHQCVSASTDNSQEDFQFCLLLNFIQVELIRLLGIFISWLQNHSKPYASIISKILVDCLQKSQNCKCFNLDLLYQETIYVTLIRWIRTSRTGLNSHFQAHLMTCILKDITPVKNPIILKKQTDIINKTGGKNRNAPNLLSSRQFNIDIVTNKHEREKDELKCQLALETLIRLFTDGFIRVDTRIIQELYALVIAILNEINTAAVPHPYTNPKCQSKIYELLTAFYEQETLTHLPPISVALNIISARSSSENHDVAAACRRGLNTLERLCQPVSPPFATTISLPIPTEPLHHQQEMSTEESVYMECITEISEDNEKISSDNNSPSKKEIKILSNEIINEGRTSGPIIELVQLVVDSEGENVLKSDEFEGNIDVLDDGVVSEKSVEVLSYKSENEAVRGSEIVESVLDTCATVELVPSIVTVGSLDDCVTEDEPSVKRMKRLTSEVEDSIISEEFGTSFVDEIGEY